MKLDWSVSVWQVCTAIWVVIIFFFGVMRKLDRIIAMLNEFPPHRHVGDQTIYPKGMRPNGH